MLQLDYTGLLNHLTSDELKEMLNDDTKIDSFLKDINQVKDLETEKEMIIVRNKSLAEHNLSKEPLLKELKREMQEKSEEGEQLCTRIQGLLNDYKSKSAGISPDVTLALLQIAASEQEKSSDDIANEFLTGRIDVEKFLEDFKPVREKMHLRKLKFEKMSELIRNGQNNGYSRPNMPYPGYGAPSMPSVPYPMGPLNMPMPGMFGNHF